MRDHLRAAPDYQFKMARFLENHDEQRAAQTFSFDMHKAAAVITFLSPGLRFFHQGQFDGRKKRISPHLSRGPRELANTSIRQFYDDLLYILANPTFRNGNWQLRNAAPAWQGNPTHESFICFSWQYKNRISAVTVNFAPHQSQCYLRLPFPTFAGRTWRLKDALGDAAYDRNGDALVEQGPYLDMPPWGYHLFEISEQVPST